MFVPGDQVSETIAYFIGQFRIEAEVERFHQDFDEFRYRHERAGEEPPPRSSDEEFAAPADNASYHVDAAGAAPGIETVKTVLNETASVPALPFAHGVPHLELRPYYLADGHPGSHAAAVGAHFEPHVLPAPSSFVSLIEQVRLLHDDDIVVTGQVDATVTGYLQPASTVTLDFLLAQSHAVMEPFLPPVAVSSVAGIPQFIDWFASQARDVASAGSQDAEPAAGMGAPVSGDQDDTPQPTASVSSPAAAQGDALAHIHTVSVHPGEATSAEAASPASPVATDEVATQPQSPQPAAPAQPTAIPAGGNAGEPADGGSRPQPHHHSEEPAAGAGSGNPDGTSSAAANAMQPQSLPPAQSTAAPATGSAAGEPADGGSLSQPHHYSNAPAAGAGSGKPESAPAGVGGGAQPQTSEPAQPATVQANSNSSLEPAGTGAPGDHAHGPAVNAGSADAAPSAGGGTEHAGVPQAPGAPGTIAAAQSASGEGAAAQSPPAATGPASGDGQPQASAGHQTHEPVEGVAQAGTAAASAVQSSPEQAGERDRHDHRHDHDHDRNGTAHGYGQGSRSDHHSNRDQSDNHHHGRHDGHHSSHGQGNEGWHGGDANQSQSSLASSAPMDVQTVDVVAGPSIEGTFLNGRETSTAPSLSDNLPANVHSEIAPQDSQTASASHGWFSQHGCDNGVSTTAETGSNLLVNEVSITNAPLPATFIGVAGDYHSLDAIIQTNAYSDNDTVDRFFRTSNDDAGGTRAVNVASFEHEVRDTAAEMAAAQPDAHPYNWSVSTVSGDMVFLNWIDQFSMTSDNDINVLTATGTHTTITSGENLGLNHVSFADIGNYYDLVLVGGNLYDGNIIEQSNVLLDDDRVSVLSGYGSGHGTASTSDNLLWNDAKIVNIGASDWQQGLPKSYLDSMQRLYGESDRMPNSVGADDAFKGFGELRALYVSGSIYDLQYVRQTNVLGDSDQVALYQKHLQEQMPQIGWDVSTGSNALINAATIVDYDSVGKTAHYGGQKYSDAILAQADIVHGGKGASLPDPQSLASELVAFLHDDDAPVIPDDAGRVTVPSLDHHSFDAMHSMTG